MGTCYVGSDGVNGIDQANAFWTTHAGTTATFPQSTDTIDLNGYTLKLVRSVAWAQQTGFFAGQVVTDGVVSYYVCTASGGTKSGSPPAWNTTPGAFTSDGTVTWQCLGTTLPGSTLALAFTVDQITNSLYGGQLQIPTTATFFLAVNDATAGLVSSYAVSILAWAAASGTLNVLNTGGGSVAAYTGSYTTGMLPVGSGQTLGLYNNSATNATISQATAAGYNLVASGTGIFYVQNGNTPGTFSTTPTGNPAVTASAGRGINNTGSGVWGITGSVNGTGGIGVEHAGSTSGTFNGNATNNASGQYGFLAVGPLSWTPYSAGNAASGANQASAVCTGTATVAIGGGNNCVLVINGAASSYEGSTGNAVPIQNAGNGSIQWAGSFSLAAGCECLLANNSSSSASIILCSLASPFTPLTLTNDGMFCLANDGGKVFTNVAGVTSTGGGSGDTFTLTYTVAGTAYTTTAQPYNASASTIATALTTALAATGITCSGYGSAPAWVFAFSAPGTLSIGTVTTSHSFVPTASATSQAAINNQPGQTPPSGACLLGCTATQKAIVSNGTMPVATDVRHGTAVGYGSGSAYIPTAANTLYGVNVDATTGTYCPPALIGSQPTASGNAAQVLSTAEFGPVGSYTQGTATFANSNYVLSSVPAYGPGGTGGGALFTVTNLIAANLASGVSVGGSSSQAVGPGTFTHTADYTLIAGVVDASYVLTGHSNYSGGAAGSLTLPGAGYVLTSTWGGPATFGVSGTGSTPTATLTAGSNVYSTASAFGAGGNSITPSATTAAAQLSTDTAVVTAAKGGITTATTILGVTGTLDLTTYVLISALPAVGNVASGVNRGDGQNGTRTDCPAADALSGTSYGAGGNSISGTLTLPLTSAVLVGMSYGAGGNQYSGAVTIPNVNKVVAGTFFGNNLSSEGTYPTTATTQASTQAADAGTLSAATLNTDGTNTTVVFGTSNGTAHTAAVYTAGQAAQLSTDEAAVALQAANIVVGATILGTNGTYSSAVAYAAGQAAQLASDVDAVTAAAGGITTASKILGVTGTLNMSLYTLISGVVAAGSVLLGVRTYAGGPAGLLLTTTIVVAADPSLLIPTLAETNAVIPAGKLLPVDLYAYQNTSPSWSLGLQDDAGNPVDVAGKSLSLAMWFKYGRASAATLTTAAGGGLTIGGASNNQITVSPPLAFTAYPAEYCWDLRDTTDGSVLAVGTLEVAFAG
jgi:hypothetical protein